MRAIILTAFMLIAKPLGSDADNEGCLPHRHPTDCNAFYVCDANELILTHCPPTLHFNPQLEVCDYPNAAGCAAPPTPNDCPAVGVSMLLPHPDCRLFYQCDNGTPIERQCHGQLHWNALANYCDWPQEAGCQEGAAREQAGAALLPQAPPTNATESPLVTTTRSSNTTTDEPTTETSDRTENTTAAELSAQTTTEPTTVTSDRTEDTTTAELSEKTATDCAPENGRDFEFLPHPDCQRFYMCVFGKPVEISCPDKFHYSAPKEHCVREKESGCEPGQSPKQL